MTDKEILYSILQRELNNYLNRFPLISPFGGIIENRLFDFIDPYVSAFLEPETQKLNTEQLTEFTKEETLSKIDAFKKRFNEERQLT